MNWRYSCGVFGENYQEIYKPVLRSKYAQIFRCFVPTLEIIQLQIRLKFIKKICGKNVFINDLYKGHINKIKGPLCDAGGTKQLSVLLCTHGCRTGDCCSQDAHWLDSRDWSVTTGGRHGLGGHQVVPQVLLSRHFRDSR